MNEETRRPPRKATRAERLEAELKANLKKRKELARARVRAGEGAPPPRILDDPKDG